MVFIRFIPEPQILLWVFYGSFFFFFFCCTVDLQGGVISAVQWSESAVHIYICPLVCRLHSHLGHFRGLSSILCAIQKVLTSCLYNICILCLYVNPSLLIYPSLLPYPLVAVSLFSISVTQFLLLQIGSFVLCFLDSMDKWHHLTYLSLTSLSLTVSRSIHVAAHGIISSLFMAEWYSIVYMYHILFIHASTDASTSWLL